MFSRVRFQRLKALSTKLRGGILKLRAIRRRLASNLRSKLHSRAVHMLTSLGALWAWILLKLLGAWAHVAEGFLGVFANHKAATVGLVVILLALLFASSTVERGLVVAVLAVGYLLGIRYPL